MKPIELQYTYKKLIGFTNTQKLAFKKLEQYDVNVANFIRIAVKEKIAKDWKTIKEKKERINCPF